MIETPSLARLNARDCGLSNAIINGDAALRISRSEARSDGSHVSVGQLGLRMAIALGGSASFDHVSHVVRLSSQREMIRANAKANVAAMANDETLGDRPMVYLEADSMGIDHDISIAASDAPQDHPVSRSAAVAGPDPAIIGLGDLAPEPRGQRIVGLLAGDVAGVRAMGQAIRPILPCELRGAVCTCVREHRLVSKTQDYAEDHSSMERCPNDI